LFEIRDQIILRLASTMLLILSAADLGVLVPWASNPDGAPRPHSNGYRRYPLSKYPEHI